MGIEFLLKNKKNIIYIALIVSVLHAAYLMYIYLKNDYFPAPFVVEKFDTFMDFYNTLYWSQNDGIYAVWGSIYPPLNFILLDFIRYIYIGDLFGDPIFYREISQSKIFGIILLYSMSLLLSVQISYSKVLKLKYRYIFFLLFLLSPPFLFALERGNLLILCLPILSLYALEECKSYKSILLAILINLKPYFLIFYIIEYLNGSRGDKRRFIILTPIYSLMIFLITGLFLGQEFYLLPLNILGFAGSREILNPQNILAFPSSILSFIYLKKIIPSFTLAPYIAYGLSGVLFIYIFKFFRLIYSNNKIDDDYLTLFGIIFITNYSTTTGGYSLIFYIPLLANLIKRKLYKPVIAISVIFLCLFDQIPIYREIYMSEYKPFLSDEIIEITQDLHLTSILNPILNFYLLIIIYNYLKKGKNEKISS